MRQKVFISWSGEGSKAIADALQEWIPLVLQAADPWISSGGIEPGDRWYDVLIEGLKACKFGIICATSENLSSPWVLFEAGALGNTLELNYVCPYLLGVETGQLPPPLTHFQSARADKNGTFDLISALNRTLREDGLPPDRLRKTFEKWWPDLSEKLRQAQIQANEHATSQFDQIEGPNKRTERIIQDLEAINELPADELSQEVIRLSGFLSSFAINEEEPSSRGGEEYHRLLLKEKEMLLVLARRGCQVYCTIRPPQKAPLKLTDVTRRRLECLAKFLESDDEADQKALRSINFAVSPFYQKNIYILGERCCFEGFKVGVQEGYDSTFRQSKWETVRVYISVYERIFQNAHTHTFNEYNPECSRRKDFSTEALNRATLRCLKESLKTRTRGKKRPQRKRGR